MVERSAASRWPRANSAQGGRSAEPPAFAQGQRVLLLVLLAVMIVGRLPHAWTHGRFLDEEATVFLAYAWHYPAWDAVWRPFAGYLNLGATASTALLAALVRHRIVTLEYAPYATMAIALAFQLLPAVLILTGRVRWLDDRATVLALLITLALVPTGEEVFFNVLHIQFHLALCTALIVAVDMPQRCAARVGYNVILALAALCGPGAIVLWPLFALRTLIDRDRGRLVQTAVFAAAATVQLLCFYQAAPVRGDPRDPATVLAMIAVRLIVMPLAGFANAYHAGEVVLASWRSGGGLWRWVAAAAAMLCAALLAVAMRRRDGALWLALAGMMTAAASFSVGAIMPLASDLFSPGAGSRYNYLPLILLAAATIVIARRPARWRPLWAAPGLIALAFAAVEYFRPLPEWAKGPVWPVEVAAWRRDHRHPLAVWPAPLTADLSDTGVRCGRAAGNDAVEPRYCEGGYTADLYRRAALAR